MLQGKLVGVAHHKVFFHGERGKAIAEPGIDRVYFFAHIGRLIDRFAESVAGKQLQALTRVAKADLQSIVVGIANRGLVGIAAKIGAERSASPVHGLSCGRREDVALAERTAGCGSGSDLADLTQTQTQRGVTGVGLHQNQQTVGLIAHVAGAEQRVVPNLPLEGDHVLLGIRNAVVDRIRRDATDRNVLRPVDVRVGVTAGGVQGREGHRKILAQRLAIGGSDERVGKLGWSGTTVGGSVGSVGREDSDGEGLDGRVIHAEAGANAGFAWTAEDFTEKTVGRNVRRIGEADARRKFIARRRQRAPHPGIGGVQDSQWRARKNDRLLARFRGRNLVVLFIPGFDAIPARTVIKREVRPYVPTVLGEDSGVFVPSIERIQLTLVVLAGNPEQKIGEIKTSFAAGEQEVTVELGNRIYVDLIVVKLAAEFEGVTSDYLRKIIEPLPCIVGL